MIGIESVASLQRFYRFLIRKRWVYIAFSLLICLALVYKFVLNTPLKMQKYVASFSIPLNEAGEINTNNIIKNSDEKIENYLPIWKYSKPYSIRSVYNIVESADIIREAGREVNFRVRYFNKGADIYADSPVELRVTSNDVKTADRDNFVMELFLEEDKAQIIKIKGFIGAKEYEAQDLIIKYGEPYEFNSLKFIINKIDLTNYIGKKIKIKYSSEVDLVSTIDMNLDVDIENENSIVLRLTSDYTREFVTDFIERIRVKSSEKVKKILSNQFENYNKKLDDLILNTGDELSSNELKKRVIELREMANVDRLILEEQDLITYIDEPYLDIADSQSFSPMYYYLIIGLLFLIFATLMLLFELLIRPIALNISELPDYLQSKIIYKVNDKLKDIDLAAINTILSKNKEKARFVLLNPARNEISSTDFANEMIAICEEIEIVKYDFDDKKLIPQVDDSAKVQYIYSDFNRNLSAFINLSDKYKADLVLILRLGSLRTYELKTLSNLLERLDMNINLIVIE